MWLKTTGGASSQIEPDVHKRFEALGAQRLPHLLQHHREGPQRSDRDRVVELSGHARGDPAQRRGEQLVLVGKVIEQHPVAGARRGGQRSERGGPEALQQDVVGHTVDCGLPTVAANIHEIGCSRHYKEMLCSTRYTLRGIGPWEASEATV